MTWLLRDLDCELDLGVVCTGGLPFVRSRVDRLNGFGRFGGSERKEQKRMPFGEATSVVPLKLATQSRCVAMIADSYKQQIPPLRYAPVGMTQYVDDGGDRIERQGQKQIPFGDDNQKGKKRSSRG